MRYTQGWYFSSFVLFRIILRVKIHFQLIFMLGDTVRSICLLIGCNYVTLNVLITQNDSAVLFAQTYIYSN